MNFSLLLNKKSKIHFLGIGGCGMSAIARIFKQKGYEVSGSDPTPSKYTQELEALGVNVHYSHKPENLSGCNVIVASSAITEDNIELRAARKMGIPICHRSEALADIIHHGKGVAVSGTHGKTTTSGWLAHLMTALHLDPTFIIGGILPQFGVNSELGKGEYIIAEADESDGSFLRYHPYSAILTNCEAEHMDHFGTYENMVNTMRQFCEQVSPGGNLIICDDDKGLRKVTRLLHRKYIRYSVINPEAEYMAVHIKLDSEGSQFDLVVRGKKQGRCEISLLGIHNVSNALGIISFLLEEGISWFEIQKHLDEFTGASRRFEIKGSRNGVWVVDDYAHHPSEVRATLESARIKADSTNGRLIAVFQPHRFTRTAFFKDEFAGVFTNADLVGIMEIYSAGEKPIDGISGKLIYDKLKQINKMGINYCPTIDSAVKWVDENAISNDWVVVLGAGDVWKVGELFLKKNNCEYRGMQPESALSATL